MYDYELTVEQFLNMFVEPTMQRVTIYDIETNTNLIENATLDDINDYEGDVYLQFLTVQSLDCLYDGTDVITINVDTSYDE